MSQARIDDLQSSQNSYVFGTRFSLVEDFRLERQRKFNLTEIIQVAVCAVLSGAENWNEIEAFACAKEIWLRKFLKLESGIPSHDTFRRVFSLLHPKKLEHIFEAWVKERVDLKTSHHIAIDGKTLRGSRDCKTEPVHLVSAFLPRSNLVLAQERVPKKQNELEAIDRLMRRFDFQGHTITIDALGCQQKVVDLITEKKANYVLSLKRNQIATYDEVAEIFLKLSAVPKNVRDFDDRFDDSHGRLVRRTTRVSRNLRWLQTRSRWAGLKSLVQIESVRQLKPKGRIGRESRFFISSLDATATQFQEIVRDHWGIENRLHWALDVSFREDQSRLRFGNSAENFSLLRRLSLNLIRSQATLKASGVLSIRRRAGWDENFLESLIDISPKPAATNLKPLNVSDLFLSPASYREWSESIR